MLSELVGPLALIALAGGACARPEPSTQIVPQRIIALAPSVVELLYALELGDRVVGVGDYVDWPEAAASQPRLGGLFNPQLESIARLTPDLVILLPSETLLGEQMRQLGVETLTVPSSSLADVESAALLIARRFGVTERATSWLAEWREQLAPPEPLEDGLTLEALLLVGRPVGKLGQLLVAGPGTFLDELLRRAGATNVLGDSSLPYPQIGLETVVGRTPQVIFELQGEPLAAGQGGQWVADWQELRQLPAVRDDCVYVIDGGYVLVPGPRLPRLYREMLECLADCAGRLQ